MWKRLLPFIPIAVVLVLWEIASDARVVNPSLFPPPSDIAQVLGASTTWSTFLNDLASSLWRMVVGFGIGSTLGIVAGLATGRIHLVEKTLAPIINTLRPLPPVALIPLFIVWFGIGDVAKIAAIAFAVFFPVWVNTHIGAEQISKVYLWSSRLLTRSRSLIARRVIFPASLPFIMAGMRTGIAFAFIMVFVSELAGASSGIGYRISVSHLAYRIDEMMAALLILGGLGALTDQLFVLGMRKLNPWLALNGSNV